MSSHLITEIIRHANSPACDVELDDGVLTTIGCRDYADAERLKLWAERKVARIRELEKLIERKRRDCRKPLAALRFLAPTTGTIHLSLSDDRCLCGHPAKRLAAYDTGHHAPDATCNRCLGIARKARAHV